MEFDRKLTEYQARYRKLQEESGSPELFKDQKRYSETMRELAYYARVDEAAAEYFSLWRQLSENRDLLKQESDPEMVSMIQEEIRVLEESLETKVANIRLLLIPPDPLDGKNIIMEIRAGTGGDEAALFAADAYRMYHRFAEQNSWKCETISLSEGGIGGIKEIVISVSGKDVYSFLRYESGVHRVQRVPATETQGRIHTSAITVAVLPEAEETEIDIKPEDLRVDVFRSSGPGGQSVNTTDSAVRLTHVPTGLVVTCQDEKSQIKNRAKAMQVLRARLFELEESKKNRERARQRKGQIGSGDRSERIRTYNFPQNRLSDHRINLTLYKLDQVMEGSLLQVIEPLQLHSKEQRLNDG